MSAQSKLLPVNTTLADRLDHFVQMLYRHELSKVEEELRKALKRDEQRRKAEAKQAAETAANEHGFSLADLIGDKSAKGPKSAPKYANPADLKQTWTGRGRQPQWVKAALEAGKSLDDLKIAA